MTDEQINKIEGHLEDIGDELHSISSALWEVASVMKQLTFPIGTVKEDPRDEKLTLRVASMGD